MQIYDPSTVSNNSDLKSTVSEVLLANQIFVDEDEIKINENDFTIGVNNNDYIYENVYNTQPMNSDENKIYIYDYEYEIIPTHQAAFLWENYYYKIKIIDDRYDTVKERIKKFREANGNPTVLKLTVSFTYNKTLLLDWKYKYFTFDENYLFSVHNQSLGRVLGDTISTNFVYLNNSSKDIFQLQVAGFLLLDGSQPRMHIKQSITIEVAPANRNPRTITTSLFNNAVNENSDSTTHQIIDSNNSLQLKSDGIIQSKDLTLIGDKFSLKTNDENKMTFNYLSKSVMTFEPANINNQLITQVKFNPEFIKASTSDKYLTIDNGVLGMKEVAIPMAVFELNNGMVKMIKSKSIKKYSINGNQIKLVFDTKQDIYFPQIQFSSLQNSFASFVVCSDIISQTDNIVLTTQDLNTINGTLYIKIN